MMADSTPGTDPATRARALADRHCPDTDIADALVIECRMSMEGAQAVVSAMASELRCRRGRFRATLRERFDQLARNELEETPHHSAMSALVKQVEVYLGWKPSDDKAKPKAGRPHVVNGGKAA